MEKREKDTKRVRKRLEIRFGPEDPRFIGYSGNISPTGLMVRTTRVFAPGTVLIIELIAAGRAIPMRGRVMWARQGDVRLLGTGRIGMGIRLIEPPDGFLDSL